MVDPASIANPVALPAPPAGWFDYGYTALMDGKLALVRTRVDVHAEWSRWRQALIDAATNGGESPPQPNLWDGDIRLSTFDGETESKAIYVPPGLFPKVDRTPDGDWLVVASRAKDDEPNARFFAEDGTPSIGVHLGDAIEHICCAPDGTIWVGYFDEGVFGGRNKDGDWKVSTGGIVQFDRDGAVLWSFNEKALSKSYPGRSRFHVDDCYAMTLCDTILWACYYADFPIARVEKGTVALWANDVAAAEAIAVADEVVIFAGFCREDANRIAVAKLEGDSSRELGGIPL